MINEVLARTTQEKYNDFSTKYDLVMAIPEFIFLRKLRWDLIASASGDILEIAAGTGRNFSFYGDQQRVTAIDLSPDMLEISKKRAQRFQKDIRLLVMDAEVLDFSEQTFDTVISTLALCTFPNPRAVIKEMSRVCRKTGKLFFLEHGRSSYERIGKWQDRMAGRFARHFDCHMNRRPVELIEQAGLKIINQKHYYWGIVNVIEAISG